MRTIAVLGGALAIYVAVTLLVAALTGDALTGAAAANITAFVLFLVYRQWSTGTPQAAAAHPIAKTSRFWGYALSTLVVCWLAGQSAGMSLYLAWGSDGFDAVAGTQANAPLGLLLVSTVVFAPIGEESLLRGIAYPALRTHWSPLVAAVITALGFAVLHGNIVQIALTVPLGILLAFVYESSQRLWPLVLMHAGFNAIAFAMPVPIILVLANPLVATALVAAAGLSLYLFRQWSKGGALADSR